MIEQTNLWDCFCNLCISIMENLSHQTGMSYGLINVLLFVILGPFSTVALTASSLLFAIGAPGKYRKIFAWSLFGIGVACMLTIFFLAAYGFLTMPITFFE